MNIRVRTEWDLVMNDQFHALDVETSCGDVGGYEHRVRVAIALVRRRRSGFESIERLQTSTLLHTRVKPFHGHAKNLQKRHDPTQA